MESNLRLKLLLPMESPDELLAVPDPLIALLIPEDLPFGLISNVPAIA